MFAMKHIQLNRAGDTQISVTPQKVCCSYSILGVKNFFIKIALENDMHDENIYMTLASCFKDTGDPGFYLGTFFFGIQGQLIEIILEYHLK